MSRRVSFFNGSTDTAMDRSLQIALRFYADRFEVMLWERPAYQKQRNKFGVHGLVFCYPSFDATMEDGR